MQSALHNGQDDRIDVGHDLRSITGAEVSAVTLDYRVSLQLLDPKEPLRLDAWLVIGVPFSFAYSSGSMDIDPETPSTMEPCWRLLRRRITKAEADEDMNLIVAFDDDSQISVPRSDLYEAWELHGTGVSGLLAGPR